ncbi:Ribosomal RNA large subunit methyltransferase H [Caulifigura coniformis]|uniref:Ribosomal RNA large subunit methyltransferase H n=1 Tax=Caulifigura coniformis TaxID=2527983 RepID=A0A517SIY4_9PLAN|nr:23S rRNA (pseudouridine(1915)-N(3))-methyltransferase RlmH [Caulifigura coniformis]QDT56091.1 Ribosomal RNA large subunit methyltransferase H [Caulifigura coniformis]
MRIVILSVTGKQPAWVLAGVDEYAKRLKSHFKVEFIDLKAEPRSQGRPVSVILEAEAARILDRIPSNSHVIALDERGSQRTTQQLAALIGKWKQGGETIVLVIGGPDGLAPQIKDRARSLWALSLLTLPHGLAKVLLTEQLYRAASLLEGHPYHRE